MKKKKATEVWITCILNQYDDIIDKHAHQSYDDALDYLVFFEKTTKHDYVDMIIDPIEVWEKAYANV